MRRRRSSALLLVLAGCSSDPILVSAPGRSAGSAIVVATGVESGVRANGIDFPGRVELEVILTDEPLKVYTAFHPCSLAWLGAPSAGIDATGAGGGTIPPHSEVAVAELSGDELSSFSPVGLDDPAVAAVRLNLPAPGARCVAFETQPVTLPKSGDNTRAILGVPVGGEAILVAYDTPVHPQLISGDGAEEVTTLPVGPYLAGHLAAPGDIWLALADGRVLRGDLALGFTPAPSLNRSTPTPPLGEGRMVSGGSGASFELYIYSVTGAIERFDGDRWTQIGDTPPEDAGRSTVGLVWVSPGELFAAPGDSDQVYHLEGARFSIEVPFQGNKVRSIALVPGYGILAGLESGGVLQRLSPSEWRSLGETEMAQDIRVIAALDNGFIVGGGFGGLTSQLHPEEAGYCVDDPITGEFNTLVPIPSGFFVLPRRKGAGDLVAYYRRRSAPRALVPCR